MKAPLMQGFFVLDGDVQSIILVNTFYGSAAATYISYDYSCRGIISIVSIGVVSLSNSIPG